jgi:hypothetical protein
MNNPNPYAAPQGMSPFGEMVSLHQDGEATGLWREGDVLVMHKAAPLPDVCVKSNEPATRRLKRTMYWHHPAVFFALLANFVFYAILAMCLRKKAVIHIPMTDAWFARRRRRMLLAWGLFGIGLLALVGAIGLADQHDAALLLLPLAAVIWIVAAFVGALGARMVYPKRITDQYVWIKGVHPSYLDRLPVWPYHI